MIVNLFHALIKGKVLRIKAPDGLDSIDVLCDEAVEGANGGCSQPTKVARNPDVGAEGGGHDQDQGKDCHRIGREGVDDQEERAQKLHTLSKITLHSRVTPKPLSLSLSYLEDKVLQGVWQVEVELIHVPGESIGHGSDRICPDKVDGGVQDLHQVIVGEVIKFN